MINKAREPPDEDLWNQGVRGRKVEVVDREALNQKQARDGGRRT